MKNIIWLASYPKSGNTWFRAFLTYLMRPDEKEIDINNLMGGPIASSREHFDEVSGVPASDLTKEEIENLRPDVYRFIAQKAKEPLYKKIHDAYIITQNGEPLVPKEITKGVIYFIRNPLDIAASFANHLNKSIDKTIQLMANENYAFCSKTDKLHNQLEQKLYTWSHHVTSWIDDSHLPIHVVRYEDMMTHPFDTFSSIIRFLKLSFPKQEIEAAITASSFENMKTSEKNHGFKEKSPDSEAFFRRGIAGGWTSDLTQKQIRTIVENHYEVMKRFNYLPK